MTTATGVRAMTRRQLLARGSAAGAVLIAGPGYLLHEREAWAVEVTALAPHTMATLVLMARDIYPHDHVPDRFYAEAVKVHDTASATDTTVRDGFENGVADLDARARERGAADYVSTGWEADRGARLRGIEATAFFQTVRSGLVVGLYNQKALWPLFGYEGSSHEHGGYLHRGFDDI
ncbi:MAG: Twin-arginine translocation pathway signal, partial [Paracoccaceae bacterium]